MRLLQSGSCPELALNQQLTKFEGNNTIADVFGVHFSYEQYYLPGSPLIELVAVYSLTRVSGEIVVSALVTDFSDSRARDLEVSDSASQLSDLWGVPLLPLASPVLLQPVAIEKPWGQEIWFTGIEERGLSRVCDGDKSSPLSWWLAVAPKRLAEGAERKINLLKILDPLPEEVFGDLYYELHEEKQEVYVVTHVDKKAWPAGKGAIRFGFDSKRLEQAESHERFRTEYTEAVLQYREVREEIDAALDECRRKEGVELNAPISAERLKGWLNSIPEQLQSKEKFLRDSMNSFTALLPLSVGDVVRVPTLTPHALQHGVRTVEFQTPVYERMILSFAQKVLTQDHWDTHEAVQKMSLHAPEQPPLKVLERSDQHTLEQVVEFDDFIVRRLTLHPDAEWELEKGWGYGLIMSVSGTPVVSGKDLPAEQALYIPANSGSVAISATSKQQAVLLLAEPVQPAV
ncbi:hypothetical protein QP938_06810 [Porticoccaceae bacterium LTM1]|nr:hypothetical protein QP938_06810 [Porticoccaceae bacterium LTM1]